MDDHYPLRSAFSLLDQVIDEYQKSFGETWKSTKEDSAPPWPYLGDALTKFQDPAEADKLLKIQRELDETKIILHKTIDSVLARGEKLDSLSGEELRSEHGIADVLQEIEANEFMLYYSVSCNSGCPPGIYSHPSFCLERDCFSFISSDPVSLVCITLWNSIRLESCDVSSNYKMTIPNCLCHII